MSLVRSFIKTVVMLYHNVAPTELYQTINPPYYYQNVAPTELYQTINPLYYYHNFAPTELIETAIVVLP